MIRSYLRIAANVHAVVENWAQIPTIRRRSGGHEPEAEGPFDGNPAGVPPDTPRQA